MEKVKKLSITHCKKILESGERKYSDDEAEKIRDLLHKLGELDYRIYVEATRCDENVSEQNKAA